MRDEKNIYNANTTDMWQRTGEPLAETEEPRVIQDSGQPESFSCLCGNITQSDFLQDETRGEVSCKSCGVLILSNIIDPSAPTRRFNQGDPSVDNAHYGAPASNLFADKGLRTTFNPMEANRKDRQKSFILKRINQQTVTNKERNLAVALRDIERVISRGGLIEMQ